MIAGRKPGIVNATFVPLRRVTWAPILRMVHSKSAHFTDVLAPWPSVQKICLITLISCCGSAIGNSGAVEAAGDAAAGCACRLFCVRFFFPLFGIVAVLLMFSGFANRYLRGGLMVLLLYEEGGLISNGQSFLKCSFLKATSDISKLVHSQ